MVSRYLLILLSTFAATAVEAANVELIYERGDKSTDLQVELQWPQQDVYERGQAVILYQIETKYPALHLRYTELNIDNATTHRIPIISEQIGDNHYRHYFGWTVHPFQAGDYTIIIPDVAYYRGGNINYRLKGQTIQLKVHKVPDYIPRHLPVGLYTLQINAPSFWLMRGSEVYFDMYITTDGIDDAITRPNPPDLFHTYEATQAIQLNSINTTLDRNGLHTRYHYLVPIKINHSGLLRGKVMLQWFEPQSHKLQSQVYPAPGVLLLNHWQLIVVAFLILLIVVYPTHKFSHFLISYLHRLYGYFRLQRQFDNLSSTQQLRYVLASIARAEGLQNNLPISQLLEPPTKKWPIEQRVRLIDAVNSALYGNGELVHAVAGLRNLSQQRMGLLAIFWRNRPQIPQKT